MRRALGVPTISARKAPPDMLSGRSKRACLYREVPTDREAHGQNAAVAAELEELRWETSRTPKQSTHAQAVCQSK